MVLEFLPGETLQDRLKRLSDEKRLLSIEESIQYTINICDALGYAHQRGMVHRDIKPANIMLDIHNQAILMDFGIVKIVGGDSHTATGAVVGTARYMSPEVIRAEVPDARADIYSLGVTLYEMLSGRTPFMADSAMTLMMMHLNDPVPDPRNLRADVPQAMVDVLVKAMSKNREDRFRTAAEFAAALKGVSVRSGESHHHRPHLSCCCCGKHPVAFHTRSRQETFPHSTNLPYPPCRLPRRGRDILRPPPPAAPKKKSGSKLWIIGIVAVLFLCAVIVVGGGGAYMLSDQFFSNSAPTLDVDAISTAAMLTVEIGSDAVPRSNHRSQRDACPG